MDITEWRIIRTITTTYGVRFVDVWGTMCAMKYAYCGACGVTSALASAYVMHCGVRERRINKRVYGVLRRRDPSLLHGTACQVSYLPTLSAYAHAVQCPVLISCMVLPMPSTALQRTV